MGLPAIDLANLSEPVREIVREATREGDEVLVTNDGRTVAKIVPLPARRIVRQPGSARGMIEMADDFDATPEDFKDYV
jgi:antitoxin (DNA-binding transcriptional repressor) of toxin-antitoxin stability system